MNYFRIVVIGLIIATIPSQVYSRSCDRDEYDKAEYFAERAGSKIVNGYGGGQDIRVNMSSCKYNSYSGVFKVTIEIYWRGAIFRSHRYNIDGELKMKSDGSQAKFSETYANSRVKNIRFLGYVAGGAILLGAIAAENHR